jgi:hypothetical protein
MNAKVLSQMSREEVIQNAAKVLCKLGKKNFDIFGYKALVPESVMVTHLTNLLNGEQAESMLSPMSVLAFVDTAATWYRLPVWWDNDRVSVNGCHVDFAEFNGDAQRAKLWATLKAFTLHAN